MSSSPPRLEAAIRALLQPILKQDGFIGSGRIFRNSSKDIIIVLSIQGSVYGGQFAINLGLQPTIIADITGNIPDPKKITGSTCILSRRLADKGSDQWWKHDNTEAGMSLAVTEATEIYIKKARPLLMLLQSQDSPIYHFSPKDLGDPGMALIGFQTTLTRTALIFSRLRKAQGRIEESRAFARHGLTSVGNAVSLKAELTSLANQ